MKHKLGFVLITSLLLLLMIVLSNHQSGDEKAGGNQCDMTKMTPEYQTTSFSPPSFPRYTLYRYVETSHRLPPRPKKSENLKTRSAPVLFIHGNAGSYKQGRSLGFHLEAANIKAQANINYDLWVVDFDEQLAAFSADIINKQSDYVIECLQFLKTQYNRSEEESLSSVIVGHSIGGIVSRNLVTRPGFQMGDVSTIMSLSTPIRPFLFFDEGLLALYHRIDREWRKLAIEKNYGLIYLGFCGGVLDEFISAAECISPETPISYSLETKALPDVRMSMQHHTTTWCYQLLSLISKAIVQVETLGEPFVLPRRFNALDAYKKALKLKKDSRFISSENLPSGLQNFDENKLQRVFDWDSQNQDGAWFHQGRVIAVWKKNNPPPLIVCRSEDGKFTDQSHWAQQIKSSESSKTLQAYISEQDHSCHIGISFENHVVRNRNRWIFAASYDNNTFDEAISKETSADVLAQEHKSIISMLSAHNHDLVSIRCESKLAGL
eukprot:TRINITY_DN4520_c0_g2_i1.p1 TRINITY_DN4520_c0_g2~~TRINITY_DN4520_c0_g2_i1.p1  ORF type:complete len:506 (-),score=101.80 TRINITY_DN4520_c0_g2_i1:2780-4258(-)